MCLANYSNNNNNNNLYYIIPVDNFADVAKIMKTIDVFLTRLFTLICYLKHKHHIYQATIAARSTDWYIIKKECCVSPIGGIVHRMPITISSFLSQTGCTSLHAFSLLAQLARLPMTSWRRAGWCSAVHVQHALQQHPTNSDVIRETTARWLRPSTVGRVTATAPEMMMSFRESRRVSFCADVGGLSRKCLLMVSPAAKDMHFTISLS